MSVSIFPTDNNRVSHTTNTQFARVHIFIFSIFFVDADVVAVFVQSLCHLFCSLLFCAVSLSRSLMPFSIDVLPYSIHVLRLCVSGKLVSFTKWRLFHLAGVIDIPNSIFQWMKWKRCSDINIDSDERQTEYESNGTSSDILLFLVLFRCSFHSIYIDRSNCSFSFHYSFASSGLANVERCRCAYDRLLHSRAFCFTIDVIRRQLTSPIKTNIELIKNWRFIILSMGNVVVWMVHDFTTTLTLNCEY